MKIWFMFDNHTFERISEADRSGILEHAHQLFREDGCGCVFVRDDQDGRLEALTLHGKRKPNGQYGVSDQELHEWADKIEVERSFRTLMV